METKTAIYVADDLDDVQVTNEPVSRLHSNFAIAIGSIQITNLDERQIAKLIQQAQEQLEANKS